MHYLFYFGAQDVDTWTPEEYDPLITFDFFCGCEITIELDGAIAEGIQQMMCDAHFHAITNGDATVALH